MKTYNQFLNESISDDNFIFAINIKNASKEDIDKIFELAIECFDKFLEYNQYQITDIEKHRPFAIVFNMYKVLSKDKNVRASLNVITVSNWEAYKYLNNITSEEFLNVGFENIKNYIELKNGTNKYNL